MRLADGASMPSRNYQDLIAWQRAMDLVEVVYRESAAMPLEERFGLIAQMRRASTSIPPNVAEGQGRRTCGEFLNHLSIAHGSVRELGTHAILAGRLGLLAQPVVAQILERAAEVGRLVTGAREFPRALTRPCLGPSSLLMCESARWSQSEAGPR
jgi:four helix bundle protein